MKCFAVLVFSISMLRSASAQCPAAGETNANKASAATLARLLGINAGTAGNMATEIGDKPLEGHSDLEALAARYRVSLPAQLVVCALPAPAAEITSIDPEKDGAINVNSVSEDTLGNIRVCGVSDAEIHQIALTNKNGTRFADERALRAFLARHTPTKARARFCNGLTFKFNSR